MLALGPLPYDFGTDVHGVAIMGPGRGPVSELGFIPAIPEVCRVSANSNRWPTLWSVDATIIDPPIDIMARFRGVMS